MLVFSYNQTDGKLIYRMDNNEMYGCTYEVIVSDIPDADFTSSTTIKLGGLGDTNDIVQFAALMYAFPSGSYTCNDVDAMMEFLQVNKLGYSHI